MYERAGLIYKGSRGSHHHYEDPQTGMKYTLAGNHRRNSAPTRGNRLERYLQDAAAEMLQDLRAHGEPLPPSPVIEVA
jgi:hypothetical protein